MRRAETWKWSWVFSAMIGLTSCAPDPFGPDASVGAPSLGDGGDELGEKIVNGAVDKGHPFVGSLTTSGSLCSATLVGRATVLTARHCVDGSGLTFTLGGLRYAASRVISYPGSTLATDIALVILSQQPSGVAPGVLNIDPVKSGQGITLVGFGRTSENGGGAGTKRMGQSRVSSINSTQFSFGSSGATVCNGDSGGPTFVVVGGQERVAGVHSTKSGACGWGGTDIRVDAFKDWIRSSSNGDVQMPGQGSTTSPTSPGAPSGARACTTSEIPLCNCPPTFACCPIDGSCMDNLANIIFTKCKDDPSTVCAMSGGQPSQSTAVEGQACNNRLCKSGLACATVFSADNVSSIGKYCMEICRNPGGADTICDGGERCTQSRTVGPVCFNGSNSAQGFTNPD